MEMFIFRHAEYERLYNCSLVNIDAVPIEKRRYPVEAVVICVLCLFYYMLYIPCMCSIWRHQKSNHCYMILFYIGVLDMGVMWICGLLHGILSLQGAVYCTYPTLIYICGCVASCLWFSETATDLILAINRCTDLISEHLSEALFSGWRTYVWLSTCSLYGLYWLMFQKPITFSGIYFTWFFDPFKGYIEDTDGVFESHLHNIHNCVIAITLPSTYLIFAIILYARAKYYGSVSYKMSRVQMMTFAQVIALSLLNIIAPSVYVYLQHVPSHQWLVTVGTFAWFHVHGFPPVIYLTLNQTIRNDCKEYFAKLFKLAKFGRNSSVEPTGTTAMLQATTA